MIDKLPDPNDVGELDLRAVVLKLDEVVEAVNLLLEQRDRHIRASATGLMLNLHTNPKTPLTLMIVHAAPDGEPILAWLMDKGMVQIVDNEVVLTEAGHEQAQMLCDNEP